MMGFVAAVGHHVRVAAWSAEPLREHDRGARARRSPAPTRTRCRCCPGSGSARSGPASRPRTGAPRPRQRRDAGQPCAQPLAHRGDRLYRDEAGACPREQRGQLAGIRGQVDDPPARPDAEVVDQPSDGVGRIGRPRPVVRLSLSLGREAVVGRLVEFRYLPPLATVLLVRHVRAFLGLPARRGLPPWHDTGHERTGRRGAAAAQQDPWTSRCRTTRRTAGSLLRSARAACWCPTRPRPPSGCWPTPRARRRASPPGRAGTFRQVLTARLYGHQVMINGHALSPPLSCTAAVPAGPEPLSIAGSRLELLEAATTVTECDWMRRYGRARPRV